MFDLVVCFVSVFAVVLFVVFRFREMAAPDLVVLVFVAAVWMFHAYPLDVLRLVVGVCFVGTMKLLVRFVYQPRHLLSDDLVVLRLLPVVKVLLVSIPGCNVLV